MATKNKSKKPNRDMRRRRCAAETVKIIDRGTLYETRPVPSKDDRTSTWGDISSEIQASVMGTCSYPESAPVPPLLPKRPKEQEQDGSLHTTFEVVPTTTLEAAYRLYKRQRQQEQIVSGAPVLPVAVLNFASARRPGGGFLNGSQAQEESLAYHSALYACLRNDPMYRFHSQNKSHGVYSDWTIFSPKVPVFRNESSGLLLDPDDVWSVSVVTCPCINAREARKRGSLPSEKMLVQALEKRMRRMLRILAAHHQGSLVLGAWGCGVFGNDPTMVARLFSNILNKEEAFRNRWPHICFAVWDTSVDGACIEAFRQVFK